MPRYYFDFYDDDVLKEDDIGEQLPNNEFAIKEAEKSLREIFRHSNSKLCALIIVNEKRKALAKVETTLTSIRFI